MVNIKNRKEIYMPRRGENIHKRKDGRWEGRYKSGNDKTGKSVYTSVYGKTYKEVKSKLQEAKANATTQVVKKSNYLFKDITSLWCDANYRNLKGSTILKYNFLINKHILPYIGDYEINSMNNFMINEFVSQKLANGKIGNSGKLSPSYVKTIVFLVNSIIQFAVKENICSIVLTNNCKLSSRKKEICIFSKNEQSKLENYLQDNIDYTKLGILISLRTGLRIGEVCALKWSDIDMNNKIIHVQSTVSRVENRSEKGTKLIIEKPKTKSSIRDIPIPTDLYNWLMMIKVKEYSIYVVSNSYNFISPRTYEYRYHKILLSCGVSRLNYHALRHTFATRCIEVGVDVKTLSEILGHSNVSITLNTYVHSSMEHKRKQLEKLSSVFI